jgi:hypothetical protein
VDFKLAGPVLEGESVRLEPLERRHAPDLAVAAEENRDSYTFTWVPRADEAEAYVDAQLARAATGRLGGFCRISVASRRLARTPPLPERRGGPPAALPKRPRGSATRALRHLAIARTRRRSFLHGDPSEVP